MSVVHVDVHDLRHLRRPSVNFLAYVHSRGNSFDPKFMISVRMLIIVMCRSSSKLVHVGSKTRSLGQIFEKSFLVYFLEGTDYINIMSRSSSKLGHVGSKTRSLVQNLEKPCVHSRGHSFDSELMKLYQNVNDHNI